MPFITLPNGLGVRLGVQHTKRDKTFERGTTLRATFYDMEGSKVREEFGVSVCKPGDNFCKLFGRKRAYASLSRRLGNWLDKDSKAAIFYTVCPRFAEENFKYALDIG